MHYVLRPFVECTRVLDGDKVLSLFSTPLMRVYERLKRITDAQCKSDVGCTNGVLFNGVVVGWSTRVFTHHIMLVDHGTVVIE
jgi:hypothetical protein